MLDRCEYKNNKSFQYYGAKGIKVCKRWHKFENFYEDMGEPPEKLTIHRIDGNKGYYKRNCIWADYFIQNRNKSDNRLIECNNKKQCITAWEEEFGLEKGTINTRLSRKWSIERAITTPLKKKPHVYLTLNNETKTISQWAEIVGLHINTLANRKQYGWTDEEIITTPSSKNKND